MKNILINFGQKIKFLRKERDLSQKQLSEMSNLHINYIGMVERGERNPSLLNIEKIASAFQISISELLKF